MHYRMMNALEEYDRCHEVSVFKVFGDNVAQLCKDQKIKPTA